MWLFTKYGFYSIACADKLGGDRYKDDIDPNTVMVRARLKQHLENLQERFKDIAKLPIDAITGIDYRYRIIMPKHLWVEALSEMAMEQTWRNFKNEASAFARLRNLGNTYINALHDIWEIMHEVQIGEKFKAFNKAPKVDLPEGELIGVRGGFPVQPKLNLRRKGGK